MTSPFLEREIERIIKAVADLPGMSSVHLFSRRLPGFGPATGEKFYEDRAVFLPPGEARLASADRLAVCPDADDVIITLHGVIEDSRAREELRAAVHELPHRLNFGSKWDVRLQFRGVVAESEHFEVRIFTQ